MAVVKFMGVPIEDIVGIMGTPIENIGSIGGEEVEVGGDTGIITMGYDGSTYMNWMEQMTITSPGSNAISGYHVTAHYGGSAGSNGKNARGVFLSGINTQGNFHTLIEAVSIRSGGDSSSFGDSALGSHHASSAATNGINDRLISANGATSKTTSQIATSEYLTISTNSNSTQHTNTQQARQSPCGFSNGVNERGLTCGGYGSLLMRSQVDQITINTLSSWSNWGNLDPNRWAHTGVDNGINDRGVWLCGQSSSSSGLSSDMHILTISTGGSCSSPGFSTSNSKRGRAGVSNKTRESAIICGGIGTLESSPISAIETLTINSLSNATAWGDLTSSSGPECEGINDN